MPFLPTEPEWENLGGSGDANGVFTEGAPGASTEVCGFSQPFQFRVDDQSLGNSAILYARVKPLARSIIWISCLENSGVNTAWYDLSGSGVLLSKGSNIETATVQAVAGLSETFDIKIVFNGTLPQTNLRFVVAGSESDGQNLIFPVNGQQSFQMFRAQVRPGAVDGEYVETTDLLTFPDLQTADGAQDAVIPTAVIEDQPDTSNLNYITAGQNGGQVDIADFDYPLDEFSVVVKMSTPGNASGGFDTAFKHWGATGNRVFAIGFEDDLLAAKISQNGSTWDKEYECTAPAGNQEEVLGTFTWDGTEFRLYVNDVYLTGANLTQTTDNAISGSLAATTSALEIIDGFVGRVSEIRMYGEALSEVRVAEIAAEFGCSGLPLGDEDPPDPDPDPPGANPGAFLPNASNQIVIECENTNFVSPWVQENSVAGFTGDGYLRYNGADDFTSPPLDVIEIPIYISTAGTYEIRIRMNHDSAPANDAENDVWVKFPTSTEGLDWEKWGHPAGSYGLGWDFENFREPSPGVFTDLTATWTIGNHTIQIGGRSQNSKIDRIHIFLPPADGDDLDETLPESQKAGAGGGGNLPSTLTEMKAYLENTHGVNPSNYFYVNNAIGNDSNPGTEAAPWLTLQKAADTVSAPGSAIIVQGAGGRFYEQVTPQHSGTAGNRIWWVGDPENPWINDASESFSATWTNISGNMWRADYNITRANHFENFYQNQCSGTCKDNLYHSSHQLIYNDQQLVIAQVGAGGGSAPSSLNEGEVYWESGVGNTGTPQYVWCRLPGDVNPNTAALRIASDKKYMFDWSPYTWIEGYPGGTFGQKAVGRDYIGILNAHWRFCSSVVKLGPLHIRGTGWWVEWSSVSESKHYGAGVYGQGHTILNCKFYRNGSGGIRPEWLNNNAGSTPTLFEGCVFEANNLNDPENWEAGNKMTDCHNYSLTTWRNCIFKDENGPGLWWDLYNGCDTDESVAVIVEFCMFIRCARHAIFLEHNTEKVLIRNCGIWNTRTTEDGTQSLGAGIRTQAAGFNEIRNCTIAYNEGKGLYFKPHDTRGPSNRDVIVDNLVLQNAREPSIDVFRCEHYGGPSYECVGGNITNPCYNGEGCSNQLAAGGEWESSLINGNVFFTNTASDYFVRSINNSHSQTSDLNTYQGSGWINQSGNVIAASAGEMVEDYTDEFLFLVNDHLAGNYSTKGFLNAFVTDPRAITDYQWIIPT